MILRNAVLFFAEVVFSTGVQHGAGTDVINRALARVGNDASDAEIIKAIYQERWGGDKDLQAPRHRLDKLSTTDFW